LNRKIGKSLSKAVADNRMTGFVIGHYLSIYPIHWHHSLGLRIPHQDEKGSCMALFFN
jgi:hypothetical protein